MRKQNKQTKSFGNKMEQRNKLLKIMANKLVRTCEAKNMKKRTLQSCEINILCDFCSQSLLYPMLHKSKRKQEESGFQEDKKLSRVFGSIIIKHCNSGSFMKNGPQKYFQLLS